jgi:CBS-domain-containing membrane protein
MLEVTGAFNALLPLLIVCVVAALAMHYISETSINTERLVRRGQLVPEAYTVDPMRLHRVSDVMSSDMAQRIEQTVFSDEILHDVIPRLLNARTEAFAVLDRDGQRVGTLTVLDILSAHEWEFTQELPEPGLLQMGRWGREVSREPVLGD